ARERRAELLTLGVVRVEPASGLSTEPTRRDEIPERRRGAILVVAEVAVEHLADGEHRVEADEIGELERPQGMVQTEARTGVDRVGAADPLLEREASFVQEGDQDRKS